MSIALARRLEAIAPSATFAMAARAAKLRAEGHKVFGFGVGEPDFDTPAHIRDAAKAALDKGATRYTAVPGTPELRKAAICRALVEDRGVPCAPEQVVVGVGAKHVLFNLALALYEPGDEVIIPAPYWVSYPEQVRIVGATPVIVETREEDGFRLSPEALEKALTPKHQGGHPLHALEPDRQRLPRGRPARDRAGDGEARRVARSSTRSTARSSTTASRSPRR
jgi:aspartate aminotransferase